MPGDAARRAGAGRCGSARGRAGRRRGAIRAALITFAPGALGDRGAERRPLVAVQLHVAEAERVGQPGDLVQRLVDEHADQLDAPVQRARDARGDGRVGVRAWTRGQRMKPDRPRAERAASSASSGRVIPQILTVHHGSSPPPVSSRQAASMSVARISVSPISTASMPTRSSSSSCSRSREAGLRHHGLAGGDVGQQLVGALDVDAEVGQVAVVEAEHVGLDLQRRLELALVVHLHQRVEVERARLAQQLVQRRRARARRRSAGSRRRRPRPPRRAGRGRR